MLKSLYPPWLSEDDVNYYTRKIEKKGFTGGAKHYRNINRQISFQFDGELHRFADVIVKKLFELNLIFRRVAKSGTKYIF